MRSALHAPVPSSTLLKFLRSQSEGLCYFSANPRPGFSFDHAAPWATPARVCTAVSTLGKTSNHGPSANPQHTTLRASLLNLEFLWPSSAPSTIPFQPAHSRSRAFGFKSSVISNRRSSASARKLKWHEKLWGAKTKTGGNTLLPDDLPRSAYAGSDSGETSMFNNRRIMAVKAANEPKLRCTEFDEYGNVVLVNGEFKKSELIAKYGLLPRDLRKIDSSVLPHILVRPSAILINLLHLRVLIKADRVLVFDAYGTTDSYTQSVFMYDLEGKLRQKQNSPSAGGLPYEFRALESVLISVTTALESEFEGVREPVVRVLRELEEDIDRDKLRNLLIYSKKLGTFEQKATLVRDAIDELLEADDDLAAMYLTEKNHDLIRGEDDHTEVEMLLESYHKLCDEIVQESGNLVSNIRNTEEIIKAILDANRNSLMLLDLKFSIGTLGIGAGAFVAALYGMNLKNFIEESSIGFGGVTGFSVVFAAIVCSYGLTKLRRVQRVSMWGEGGRRGRNWRVSDPADGVVDVGRRDIRRLRLREERHPRNLEEMKAQQAQYQLQLQQNTLPTEKK
ncbi:hypothetical protein BP5796_01680 [Coleophoma crateriformis]|uniref:Magnesium transporter n=1 Tax=Coleophoma crateriformis TaxID=565419 RepID=A0A3D8T150_9HELO|nr:hypothetical protein BP5796_01680 [Coleophoma crateriformis]